MTDMSLAANRPLNWNLLGSLSQTENRFDIAIRGNGYFQVALPSGETAYTRDGTFSLSPEGVIVTADGYVVQPADVEAELRRIGHVLKPLEIVVVNTRAGSRYGEDDYVDSGCGMSKAATLWLLERGIRVVGTDGWSWDAPFSFTKKRIEQGGSPDLIWEGHRAGREIGYSHIEKLHNLELLPADGFEVICFPVKVHRGSAGWTRAVAVIED